ncbi:NACHT domain-containing protein [Microcoleus sp. F6_B4]
MTVLEELIPVIDRILRQGSLTESDRAELRQVLSEPNLQQSAKYIINIQQGKDIKVGEHTYQGADAETIKQALREVLQEKQKAKRPNLEEKFLKWVKEDVIEPRLKELRNSVEPINPDKEWQPDQVKPSKRVNLSEGDIKKITDMSILGKFEDVPKLLVLGEPGAGKTTTLFLLAEVLLQQATNDSGSPIPVYLKLSSWKRGKKTMFAWLVEALSKKQYLYGLSKKDLESLLIEHKLLLILDELDELEEDCRINCAEALNELLSKGEYLPEIETSWSPRKLLVSSRLQEYETLGFKLELNGAIYLQPFNATQIQRYLAHRGYDNFWQTLQDQDSAQLLDVLGRPLFLCIVCDAMKKISIDELNKLNSWEERQLYLFISYIAWCLQEQDDLQQTENIRLLIWLASQLKEHGQTDFFIESIQPSWLPDGTKNLYFFLVGLSIFLIFIFPPFIACVFIKTLDIFWLGGFMIDSLVTALAAIFMSKKIKFVEEDIINIIGYSLNLRSYWIRELKGKRSLTLAATLFGVGIIVSILNSIPFKSIKVVCLILLLSFLIWVFARINGREVRQKTLPNQGIWNSARNAACVAVFVPIVFAMGLSISLSAKLLISQFLPGLLMVGLPVGLTCALFCGGLACIQHFILRLILRCHEHPWNYVEFLDNAVKLKLLRRVGGRYEFMHSLLKECFALLGQRI